MIRYVQIIRLVRVFLHAHMNHRESEHQARDEQDPSRDEHVHVPTQLSRE